MMHGYGDRQRKYDEVRILFNNIQQIEELVSLRDLELFKDKSKC